MTTRIQNLSDLQDRRIMMEKKLPPLAMRSFFWWLSSWCFW